MIEESRHVKRAFTTRPFPERLEEGAYSGFHFFGERYQVAGTDRILRSVCRAAQKCRQPDGLQACHLHGGAGTHSDRKSVVEGKSVSVRVALGCCRIIKKNTNI